MLFVLPLLLLNAGNAAGQENVRPGKKIIPLLTEDSWQRKSNMFERRDSAQSAAATVKRLQRGFDRQLLETRVNTLKEISEQRTMIKDLHEILRKAEGEQAERKLQDRQERNRLKLLGKPTRFLEAPPSRERPRASLGKTASAQVTNALINGKAHDSVYVGDTFNLTFSFASGALSAIMNIYLDLDGNGAIGSDDYLLGRGLLLENDDNDEDLTTGKYKVTFRAGDDILTLFVATLIFEIDDYQTVSTGSLTVRQQPTASIVRGSVVPQMPFVACVTDELIVFADSAGKFSFNVDRFQTGQLRIRPVDVTGATNGYIPPPDQVIPIVSDTTIVSFVYTEATSFIEGYVKSQAGTPIENALVEACYSFCAAARTDSQGYYKLGVAQGQWRMYVGTPSSSNYMRDFGFPDIFVSSNATVRQDYVLVECNSSISGKVTFNGAGVSGVPVYAFSDSLSNRVLSTGDGSYAVPVHQPPVGSETYMLQCDIGSGYFVEDPLRWDIQPGATDVNFTIKKVAGGLQGRITDVGTGNPVPGAHIYVSGPTYKRTWSNDSGYYRTSLGDGIYTLNVYASPYFSYSEYPVNVSGAMVTRNVALLRSGSLSGTVKNAEGEPMRDAIVVTRDTMGWHYGSGYTDIHGEYMVSNLTSGEYRAVASKNGYVPQWYNMAEDQEQASLIPVAQGFDTPGINFVLSKGGIISGKVVEKTGSPISGVEILVYDTLFNGRSYAMTNDSGIYSASGLATGKYLVVTYSEEYIHQWYDGAATPFDAKRVNVTIDQETAGIDFTLSKGGSISGKVKSKSGVAIPYSSVTVVDSTFLPISYYYTYDDSGSYRITKLPVGKSLYVTASAYGYAQRWYDNVSVPDSATAIILAEGGERNNVNFALPLGGSITGRVQDINGYPIPYANIYAYDSLTSYYAYSNQSGSYSLAGMSNGRYYVLASANAYDEQWFDRASSEAEATRVRVVEETTTSDINFALRRTSGVFGTVVDDSSGMGVPSIYIEVLQDSENGQLFTTFTSYDGSYQMPLPPGDYVVRASDLSGQGYLGEFYTSSGGTPFRAEAYRWTLADGQSFAADFRLVKRKNFHAFTGHKLGMTITNFGQLGYWQDPTLPNGRWPLPSDPNSLFEGDLWFGGDVYGTRLVAAGAYRGIYGPWRPLSNYINEWSSDSQRVLTFFTDEGMFGGLTVKQTAYSWRDADYALYEYTIVNRSPWGFDLPPIQNAYVGFFMDLDISGEANDDMVGIDAATNLVYMYDSSAVNGVAMGVCLVRDSAGRVTWWRNGNDPRSDTARYNRMASATSTTLPDSANDHRVLLSVGPYSLDPGDTVSFMIAVVAGYGAEGVIQAAAQARGSYVTGVETTPVREIPAEYSLSQNYPNPFNPTTMIQFDLPERGPVKLEVYDMLGRRVATLVDDVLQAGRQAVEFDAHGLSSGMYVYRIEANGFVLARRMVLVR